jgi:hypothetical protein
MTPTNASRGTSGARATPGARRAAAAAASRRGWLLGGGIAAAIVAVVGIIVVSAAPPSGAEAVPVAQFTHIHGLEAPTWADGDVFVSTHFGLLRVDAAGDWTEVGTAKHDFMGFTAHPTERGVLYSSGHPAAGSGLPNPIGFMVSRDAGLTWTPMALAGRADFHVLTVQPTDGDVLYGFNAAIDPGLYRSLDGGRTWSVMESPDLMRLGGPYALAVHPDDRDVLLAGTRGGLLESRDAGRTWELVALEGLPVTAVTFAGGASTRAYAYGAAPDAGLFVGDDRGPWSSMDFVLANNDAVGYIAIDPARPDTIYLGSYGQNLYRRTEDGGRWQALALNGVPQ